MNPFSTTPLHATRQLNIQHGGVHVPIHSSVQYGYERVEDLVGVFQGTVKGYNYARQGTPTTAALEAKVNAMEGGVGTVSFATGMAAITALMLTMLRAGDHLIASQFVFGNTNSLLGTLQRLGILVSMVDATNVVAVDRARQRNTRMVFVETIANPRTQVPDLAGIGALCAAHGLMYVVDNTVTSPYLFQPKSVGAHWSMNSLTKSFGGHGNALGGAMTDTGLFDWTRYANIYETYQKGDPKGWGVQQLRKKGLRDMGGTLSSEQAHTLSVGSETLPLRVDRMNETALTLAKALEAHPKINRVYYPFLPSHEQHSTAKALFKGASWLLSFELARGADTLAFINRLRIAIPATGLADTRSLIIPVAPTIFWEMGAEKRAQMGIADGLIRLSVGLEDVNDLLADFAQALA
jgi:O-acetylhomoserine (thiol)-lyase